MDIQKSGVPSRETGQKTLAERIAGLTPEQRALYERKIRELPENIGKPRIPRVQGPGPWPVTTDQAALWFIQQLDPTTSAYNIGNGLRVKGSLNPGRLEQALNLVVQRHQILRSVFKTIDGRPCQMVTDRKLTVTTVDVSGEPDPVSAAHRSVTQLIKQPFHLEEGPLVRLSLVRIGEDDHVALGVLHHIVTDWWSYYIFYTELFAIYHALSQNRPMPFHELPIQYADWAAWRNQWESTEAFLEQQKYWLRQTEGAVHVLDVPGDRPRPAVQSHRGARMGFAIPAEIVPRVRAMNSRAGTSSFMTLLAVLGVFLWRYTGEEHFLVGTPVSADRDTPETSNLIGYMLNTLVLRMDVSGEPTFLQFLERVRTTCIGAFANKEYPFRRLVDQLRLERDMSRMPLYQVEYLYISGESPLREDHGTHGQKLEMPGFEMTYFSIDRNTSPVDLQITFVETPRRLNLMVEYNTDIYEATSIDRFGKHILVLLSRLMAEPERPLAGVAMLDAEEHRQIAAWNRTSHWGADAGFLHELFEVQARRSGASVAAICGERSLTYAELDTRANCLARQLVNMGVGPEKSTGIFLERSLDMIVAVLGVLKAGGAYLPLDPACPQARIAQMLANAAPAAILSTSNLCVRLPRGVKALNMDSLNEPANLRDSSGLSSAPVPGRHLSPLHPAYIIYTSGSTGVPKAVVVSHSNVTNFISWAVGVVGSERLSSVLAATPLHFDVSVFEIFAPLACGGIIEIVSNLAALDQSGGVKINSKLIVGVPSLVATVLEQIEDTVHTIVLGGEALSAALVANVNSRLPHCRIINGYGPTETTVYATTWHRDGECDSRPMIGRPLWNTRAYVLDRNLEQVPVGVPGELYIAGAGVARGYLNRPALTAERFLPDPFHDEPGERMYYTGDLARWSADGELEYLGRADEQVKVRGVRIELGEVEAVLAKAPGVRQCAVIAQRDNAGRTQLAAYVVPEAGAKLDTAALRRGMAELLPECMLPSAFTELAALPLTRNGKLDRRALPAMEQRVTGYAPPSTLQEAALCRIFAETLGLERVGVDDHFFLLGGHSLMITRVVSQVRTELGVELQVRALFEAPTVAELVHRMGSEALSGSAFERVLPLRARGDLPPLFCIHPAGGLCWSYAGLMRELGPGRPIYGLQADLATDAPYPASVEAIAREYLEEIQKIRPSGPYHLLGWSFGGILAFSVACLLQRQGQEVALLALMDSDPSQGEHALHSQLRVDSDEVLREAAGMLGLDVQQFGDKPLEFHELFEAADRAGHIPAGFDQHIAKRSLGMMKHAAWLMRVFRPGRFDGDLLYFFADKKIRNYASPELWKPLITGKMDVYAIHSRHGEMTQHGSIGEIGRILERHLKEVAYGSSRAGRTTAIRQAPG